MWNGNWGRQSERPDWYWQPWLGREFNIRPEDIANMTPRQLDACREEREARSRQPGPVGMGGFVG